eukprot:m.104070 g.104070  ORF g.104070 m.104070 type:complete len:103 (+) comp18869_c0_seq6:145-453(+)
MFRARARERMARMHGDEDPDKLCEEDYSIKASSLDIARTFPDLAMFQENGPYYDMIRDILGAYVCYRPDIGYIQGMSFLAAMLLLNMEVGRRSEHCISTTGE